MPQNKTNKNIIETLINQHNKLRELMVDMKNLATVDAPDYTAIIKGQEIFTTNLKKHVNLENNAFYPCLLEGWIKKGITEKALGDKKLFVEKMKGIELEVYSFLEKYKTPSALNDSWDDYPNSLENIISSLLVRLETEEDGIFMEWKFFKDEKCIEARK